MGAIRATNQGKEGRVIEYGREAPADWDTETGYTDYGTPPEPVDDNVIPIGKEMHSGQLRIAERFVSRYSNRLMYVHGLGWHCWNGTHWAEDKNDRPRRRVVELLKVLRHEAVEMADKERDRLVSDVRKCESNGGITGVLDLAKSMHPMTTSVEQIDADPFRFNTGSGTLNLTTGAIERHDPRHLITKCSAANVDPAAAGGLWLKFLEQVLPDAEVRAYLQRVFGLAMLGIVREHNLPIMSGTGGNGKSVCLDAVLHAFGDYGMPADPSLIMQQKNPRHGTFLAALHGKRLVVTSETNEGEKLAAATVKRLTGGDKIQANRMRQDPFEFTPSHSLIYCTNFKPKVDADDPAMWRRLAIIPFDQIIPREEMDSQLGEKLESESDAVLTWCWEGWREYKRLGGLCPPEAVLARTEEYRNDGDALAQFFEQCTMESPTGRVAAASLYNEWRAFAMVNNHPAMTNTEFGRKLAGRGIQKVKGRGSNQYVGISLLTSQQEPPDGELF
jgi:putative DNA primase/helicase